MPIGKSSSLCVYYFAWKPNENHFHYNRYLAWTPLSTFHWSWVVKMHCGKTRARDVHCDSDSVADVVASGESHRKPTKTCCNKQKWAEAWRRKTWAEIFFSWEKGASAEDAKMRHAQPSPGVHALCISCLRIPYNQKEYKRSQRFPEHPATSQRMAEYLDAVEL